MSQKLAGLKPKEVLRVPQRAGFFIHQVRGSHYILKHRVRVECRVTLPWHNRDLKRGNLASIIEKSGLTPDEFKALM